MVYLMKKSLLFFTLLSCMQEHINLFRKTQIDHLLVKLRISNWRRGGEIFILFGP